jgi:hypothetical protein
MTTITRMGLRVRFALVAVILVGLTLPMACMDVLGARNPTAPPSDPNRPLPPPPATDGPPPAFPTVSDAVIYDGPTPLYDELTSYHGSSLPSRYVLFNDGKFQLQFSSFRFGIFSYTGQYSRTDSLVNFAWDGYSAAGPWGSTGTVRGDTLTVRYGMVMMMSDFIDGDYVRSR